MAGEIVRCRFLRCLDASQQCWSPILQGPPFVLYFVRRRSWRSAPIPFQTAPGPYSSKHPIVLPLLWSSEHQRPLIPTAPGLTALTCMTMGKGAVMRAGSNPPLSSSVTLSSGPCQWSTLTFKVFPARAVGMFKPSQASPALIFRKSYRLPRPPVFFFLSRDPRSLPKAKPAIFPVRSSSASFMRLFLRSRSP